MSLTRKMLKAMGIEDAKIDQIIEAHTDVTDALKADRDKYKEEAERIPEIEKGTTELEKRIQALEEEVEHANTYKTKYEDERTAFEDYKKGVDSEKESMRKAEAYKGLLKKAGISDKRIDAIIKVTDTDAIVINDEGEVEGADDIVENIKSEWSEFVVTKSEEGVKTENPPTNTGGKMTKEEIMAIKDRNARQQAISENHDLFGY